MSVQEKAGGIPWPAVLGSLSHLVGGTLFTTPASALLVNTPAIVDRIWGSKITLKCTYMSHFLTFLQKCHKGTLITLKYWKITF
jgi:hypothetical protein